MSTATTAAVRPRRPHRGLRGVSAALALAALGGGCASTAAHDVHDVHDHAASPVSGAAAPTAVPATSDLRSTCTVPHPKTDHDQLTSVDLVADREQLVLAFTLARPVGPGNLTLKVVAASDSGAGNPAQGFSITTALSNGVPVAVALQTPTGSRSAGQPQDLVHVIDNQVHIGLPSSLLDQLGPRWRWSASTADATSHASCPVARPSGGLATITVER
jgi:hypothetical protein